MTKRKARPVRKTGTDITLTDATLPIVLPSGKRLAIDLLTARMAAEPVERKHNVKEGYVPTLEFWTDMAAALSPLVPGCTPTWASQIWGRIIDAWLELKKNMP